LKKNLPARPKSFRKPISETICRKTDSINCTDQPIHVGSGGNFFSEEMGYAP
jgi:hypothetical protein